MTTGKLGSLLRIALVISFIATSPPVHAHKNSARETLDHLQATDKSQPQARCCATNLELRAAQNGELQAATFRIRNLDTKEYWWPQDWLNSPALRREANWWTIDGRMDIDLAPGRYRLEAIGTLQSKLATREFEISGPGQIVSIELENFEYTPASIYSAGNTHLHMLEVSRDFADRYLEIVPAADGLDIVFVSRLEREGVDHTYISNEYDAETLAQMPGRGTRFGYGQETRQNFGEFGEGYGHVLMLGIDEPIDPVSIGPSLSSDRFDYPALRPVLVEARKADATNIWAHNDFGHEDIPSFLAGLVDAQNMFDGGQFTHYDRSVYRYWNVGMKVPLSSGTDWFMLDFARAFVETDKSLSPREWLDALEQGRSYISNGPLMDFTVNGLRAGSAIELEPGRELEIAFEVAGRTDFRAIEVIYNGAVIFVQDAIDENGAFRSQASFKFTPDEPGWIAVRTPWESQPNLFGKMVRAHTSPIYVTRGGEGRFHAPTALGLIAEMRESLRLIEREGKFPSAEAKAALAKIYAEGIHHLCSQLALTRSSNHAAYCD